VDTITQLLTLVEVGVALLMVCIPEGMPLAISMAGAFSVDYLKSEQLLIKNLEALESAGQLIDIMTGKTATLTTGDMRVNYLHCLGGDHEVRQPQINSQVLDILQNCLILNSDARMQMIHNKYEPAGSPVEVGLMKMLIEHDLPVQERLIDRERFFELKTMIPFSSERKRMTVAYGLPADWNSTSRSAEDMLRAQQNQFNTEFVRVVVKGAPENVIPLCTSELD